MHAETLSMHRLLPPGTRRRSQLQARQYLGEAYLLKGDVARAKEQLMEIADRCGGPCDDYELLVKAIAAHVTGEKTVDWEF